MLDSLSIPENAIKIRESVLQAIKNQNIEDFEEKFGISRDDAFFVFDSIRKVIMSLESLESFENIKNICSDVRSTQRQIDEFSENLGEEITAAAYRYFKKD